MLSRIATLVTVAALGIPLWAQTETTSQQPSGDSAQQQQPIQVEPMEKIPLYRVNVVSRTTEAINYRAHKGSSKVSLQGTELMPGAKGEARVDSKSGRLGIEASLEKMQPASKFGPEYLTYVLWAITPEGRPSNLGEIIVDKDGKAHTTVSTDLQSFGLIVTAEPYFAVTRPSNLTVAENIITKDTRGWAQPIAAKFEVLERGEYTVDIPASQLPSITAKPKTPNELLQAENAVAIARAAGADKYAADTLRKAEDLLARGQDYLNRKQSSQAIGTVARGATQQAEDARLLTERRKRDERIATERREQQERTQEAQAQAEAASQRAAADAARAEQAQQERLAAQQAQAQAEQARREAEAAREAALQQQQQLAAQAQQAQLTAQQAQQAQLQAEQQAQQQRERLLQQLNSVLQTRETARGLIVNMSDVLFDLNKATLKPGAKLRLAKVAGIVMAYPDLRLQIEGFTDSTGTPAYNQTLSEQRAATVRDYLIAQGVPANNVMAQGYGQSNPVATNATASGRQMNRRVDLVVSGQSIGVNNAGPNAPANVGAAGTGNVSGSTGGVAGSATTGAATSNPANSTPGGSIGAGVSTPTGGTAGAGATVNTPVGTGTVGGNAGTTTQPNSGTTPPPQ